MTPLAAEPKCWDKLKKGLCMQLYVADPSLSHCGVVYLLCLTCFSLLVNVEKFIQALCAFVSVFSIFLLHPRIGE